MFRPYSTTLLGRNNCEIPPVAQRFVLFEVAVVFFCHYQSVLFRNLTVGKCIQYMRRRVLPRVALALGIRIGLLRFFFFQRKTCFLICAATFELVLNLLHLVSWKRYGFSLSFALNRSVESNCCVHESNSSFVSQVGGASIVQLIIILSRTINSDRDKETQRLSGRWET